MNSENNAQENTHDVTSIIIMLVLWLIIFGYAYITTTDNSARISAISNSFGQYAINTNNQLQKIDGLENKILAMDAENKVQKEQNRYQKEQLNSFTERLDDMMVRPQIQSINLLNPKKDVTIYFGGNFNPVFKSAALEWLNQTYFCHSFSETKDQNASLWMVTHDVLDAKTQAMSCGFDNEHKALMVNQTGGCFFYMNTQYKNLQPVISFMPKPEVFGGGWTKSLVLHESSHFLNLEIHNVTVDNHLEFMDLDSKFLNEYLTKWC